MCIKSIKIKILNSLIRPYSISKLSNLLKYFDIQHASSGNKQHLEIHLTQHHKLKTVITAICSAVISVNKSIDIYIQRQVVFINNFMRSILNLSRVI